MQEFEIILTYKGKEHSTSVKTNIQGSYMFYIVHLNNALQIVLGLKRIVYIDNLAKPTYSSPGNYPAGTTPNAEFDKSVWKGIKSICFV